MEKFYKSKLYQSLFLAIFFIPLSAHAKPKSFATDAYENGLPNKKPATSDNALLECEHPFKVNKWDVDENRIQRCFDKLSQAKIKSFEVSAATSVKDSAETDDALSDNRQEALFSTLNKLYPGVKIYKKPNNRREEINPNRGGVIVAHFSEEQENCEMEDGQAFPASHPCKPSTQQRSGKSKTTPQNRGQNSQTRIGGSYTQRSGGGGGGGGNYSERSGRPSYSGSERSGSRNVDYYYRDIERSERYPSERYVDPSERSGRYAPGERPSGSYPGTGRYPERYVGSERSGGNVGGGGSGGTRIIERQGGGGRYSGYSEHYILPSNGGAEDVDSRVVFQCNAPINNTNTNTNNNRGGEGGPPVVQHIPAAPTQQVQQIVPVPVEAPGQKTKTVYVDRPVACQASASQYLDFSIWGGASVLFFPGIYKGYVTEPIYGFIAGISKTFYHSDSGFTSLYSGLVVDYLTSQKDTAVDASGLNNQTIFHIMNLELLLGIEQYLGGDIFALFLEAGPSVQQRNLYIRQETTAVSDYSISTLVGGSANVGLNIHLGIGDDFAFLIRSALSAHMGSAKFKAIDLTGETVNTNPFLWGGNISLGVQF